MYFALYNVTSIRVFKSILTLVCVNTRIIQVLFTASKQPPVRIIRFILSTFNNENHPCNRVRVDEFSPTYLLINSKYLWKLLVVMHHGPMVIMT